MNTQKLHGARHSEGGIKIEAEGGERIFSREDTAQIESLAKNQKFEQLGQFIKKAMSIQDSRPTMYAEEGMKVYEGMNNELPFRLSNKELDIFNQQAALNNTLTPEMYMAMGGKAAAPPRKILSTNQADQLRENIKKNIFKKEAGAGGYNARAAC